MVQFSVGIILVILQQTHDESYTIQNSSPAFQTYLKRKICFCTVTQTIWQLLFSHSLWQWTDSRSDTIILVISKLWSEKKSYILSLLVQFFLFRSFTFPTASAFFKSHTFWHSVHTQPVQNYTTWNWMLRRSAPTSFTKSCIIKKTTGTDQEPQTISVFNISDYHQYITYLHCDWILFSMLLTLPSTTTWLKKK